MLKEFQIKVLVVDDSSFGRRITINSFKEIGFQNFVEAENGLEALNVLKNQPDIMLVLLDWNMPEMSGVEFLASLRQEPEFRELPVIMVTSNGSQWHIKEALSFGVIDYLLKPFTLETVKSKFRGLPERLSRDS